MVWEIITCFKWFKYTFIMIIYYAKIKEKLISKEIIIFLIHLVYSKSPWKHASLWHSPARSSPHGKLQLISHHYILPSFCNFKYASLIVSTIRTNQCTEELLKGIQCYGPKPGSILSNMTCICPVNMPDKYAKVSVTLRNCSSWVSCDFCSLPLLVTN